MTDRNRVNDTSSDRLIKGHAAVERSGATVSRRRP